MPASALAAVCSKERARFLEGLDSHDLNVVLRAATPHQFHANSVLTMQGDIANRLFLITKGRARHFYVTPQGKKIILIWLTAGEIIGGATLLSKPYTYQVSTELVQDSSVLAWDRATIRDLATRFPRLLENGLLTAADYLAWYLADHVALVSNSARQRLARVLVCLAQGIGQKGPGGFELDVTNEELANASNITPFTASRLLSQWQRDRAVVKRRGKLLLRSPERLFLHTV